MSSPTVPTSETALLTSFKSKNYETLDHTIIPTLASHRSAASSSPHLHSIIRPYGKERREKKVIPHTKQPKKL
jgi:hypothetical protein